MSLMGQSKYEQELNQRFNSMEGEISELKRLIKNLESYVREIATVNEPLR